MDEIKMNYIEDIRAVAALNLPWEKLTGKNILISGATGLIGRCLIEVLMHREDLDFHVYASGRNKKRAENIFADYLNSQFFHFLEYDVIQTLESDIHFHYIIAAASGASPQLYSTDPIGIMKANFIGTDNLLSYGIKKGLEKFLYVSSGEIYGEGNGVPFKEEYSGYVNSTDVRACYPSSKRAAETLCIAYSHQYDVDISIARPCHIYGPGFTETDQRVYAQFIRNVIKDEDIVMKSSGVQIRSWCYVVDCVSALLYILLKGENRQAYNIADESSNLSIKELAEMIAEISKKKVISGLPDNTEKTGYNKVTQSLFTTEKIKKLGWRITGNMKEKLEKTINHYKKTRK